MTNPTSFFKYLSYSEILSFYSMMERADFSLIKKKRNQAQNFTGLLKNSQKFTGL